ncbi:hypothetical protein ACP70R_048370 [Stipagrostis hirtigluma subsp. patula]
MASTATAGPLGPVPFKDVDVPEPEHTPPVPTEAEEEELRDLVSSLPRREHPVVELRLYKGLWLPVHWVPRTVLFQRRFAPRPDDVLVASYPKCGTTWLKALAFAVMARRAHPPSAADHPLRRLNPHDCVPLVDEALAAGEGPRLDRLPSPRLMNTHLPHALLPEPVAAGGCRVVYICRDPKDMVVSIWHFVRRIQPDLQFADVFESVCDGTAGVGPVWDHVLGYWRASAARPDRVLFLRYEHLLQDPGAAVRRLAEFTGLPFSAAEEDAGVVAGVVELCSFDKLKGMEANKVGTTGVYIRLPNDALFRKGVAGDWTNHMTPEMAARLDAIVADKFQGTGLALT